MLNPRFPLIAALLVPFAVFSAVSEIKVDLKLDGSDFVIGQRIRGVVDIANSSPDEVCCGVAGAKDRFFIEVYRCGNGQRLDEIRQGAFISAFRLKTGQGQKFETFLGDHYALHRSDRYFAKPVLVHGGVRYEGMPRAFDVVDGVKVAGALQMFSNRRGLQREFELVYWSVLGAEHLFLKAKDAGSSTKRWETRDLGQMLRLESPTISILQSGEVQTMHRLDADNFIRTVFWSLPDRLEFRKREAVLDPETASTQRVRELYKEGGIKAKPNPWWKFW